MFLPVRFSRMSPVPLCTCQGHTDGWTHGPSAPPGAPPAPAGYLWRWEPSGCRGALGQHPARPRPAALARGGRLSPRPVPTLQHFQHGRGGRGLPEAVGVGRWWARPRPAHRAPWGRGTPSGAWHKRGALRPNPVPAPSQPRAPLTPPLPPSCTWCRSPARPGGRPAAEPCRGPPGRHRCKGQRCEMVAWRGGDGGVGTGFSPEEGELVPVHPGLEAQRRVLPEGRHDEAEEQRDADEDSGQDNLWGRDGGVTACSTPSRPVGAAPTGRTCAKNPRVLRRAWSSRLMKRARSCWRVSAQPRSRRPPSAAPCSRSVSCGSSAARVQTGPAPAPSSEGQGLNPGLGGTVCWQRHPCACRGAPSPPAPTSPGSLGSA